MIKKSPPPPARACLAALLFTFFAAGAALPQTGQGPVQSPAPPAVKATPQPDERAEAVVRRAVEAMGGRAFLDVRTVVSSGYFTPYKDGVATLPIRFIDYLAFPDRERTEFRGGGVRSIQTYSGDRGWLLDGMKRAINDATPEQVGDFRLAMRTSLDNVLRGWWRAGGAKIAHAGRREAGLGKRNEVVRLSYPDGFTVEFEFGARDSMPAKVLYKKKNAEGEEVEEEDRYAQILSVGTVLSPFVIDHFRAGTQSSRINYEKVDFNQPVPDSLFERPADAKAIK